jgi:hypothetical protein
MVFGGVLFISKIAGASERSRILHTTFLIVFLIIILINATLAYVLELYAFGVVICLYYFVCNICVGRLEGSSGVLR